MVWLGCLAEPLCTLTAWGHFPDPCCPLQLGTCLLQWCTWLLPTFAATVAAAAETANNWSMCLAPTAIFLAYLQWGPWLAPSVIPQSPIRQKKQCSQWLGQRAWLPRLGWGAHLGSSPTGQALPWPVAQSWRLNCGGKQGLWQHDRQWQVHPGTHEQPGAQVQLSVYGISPEPDIPLLPPPILSPYSFYMSAPLIPA